ncbi:MAG: IS21 family transposase [Thermoanaerobaculia bacterium]
MLSKEQRTAILELHAQRVSKGEIARLLGISRLTVRKVLRAGSAELPQIDRPEKATAYRQQILELLASCKGNLVRVHEELVLAGAKLSYPALTAFCRRHGIGQQPVVPSGRYHFEPGEELQHDTSPHDVVIGGRKRRVQTASAVLCYSRLLFFQCYPSFQRFDCKVFLTDALRNIGGAPERVMIDNTHVVVLRGTGREMVAAAEMAAFAERLGFRFVAHERGDANRSARVERPFWFIETNFLAGRTFSDWDDLNEKARQWCDRVNATYKKHLRAIPRELFVLERTRLKPLPAWIPPVYRLHERTVDVLHIDEFGYLNLRPEQSNIFFKLMEGRYRRRSTIITTNLDYSEWHNFLGNKLMVEALLSRLRHQCHTVRIEGPSLREPQG